MTRNLLLLPLFLLISSCLSAQVKELTLFGHIKGTASKNIYLYFEDQSHRRDSLSVPVTEGNFQLSFKAELPVLARLRLEQPSLMEDIFIDGERTELECINSYMQTTGGGAYNEFRVIQVAGSQIEKLRSGFEQWQQELLTSQASDEEKNQTLFEGLYSFVKKYPRERLSTYLLGQARVLRYAQATEISGLLHASLKKYREWEMVNGLLTYLDHSANKKPGAAFLDVVLKDPAARDFDTRSFRGKYVLVDFWASWCRPCRQANPKLKELYARYKDKDFEILGISFDRDPDQWLKAISQDRLSWQQLIDPSGYQSRLGNYYDIQFIPANLLLDREGRVVGADLSVKELEKFLRKL